MLGTIHSTFGNAHYPTAQQDEAAALPRKKRSLDERLSTLVPEACDGSSRTARRRQGTLDSLGKGNLL
ncbi:hypothetical protein G7025_10290 [Pseudomonas lurida]|uniref:hypothetical protein n=1 Tax=Pseudomonas TaxID=286 RepID=UPI0015E2F42C|nr:MULTISPECIES: hypothetical protein [Pseudomonas]MBA1293748.1 hypothetical protein [Pseudomonas lurida]